MRLCDTLGFFSSKHAQHLIIICTKKTIQFKQLKHMNSVDNIELCGMAVIKMKDKKKSHSIVAVYIYSNT